MTRTMLRACLAVCIAALTSACERGVHINPNEIIIQPEFPGEGNNYATNDWSTVEL